jgi:hypothetical protein
MRNSSRVSGSKNVRVAWSMRMLTGRPARISAARMTALARLTCPHPLTLFAVVGQQLVRDAVAAECCDHGEADRAAGGPGHDGGDDAVAGVVIDSGDDLGFGAVSEQDTADDVHLPQLHRLGALPAFVVLAAATPGT